MGEIQSYKDLLIWQKGIQIAEIIYRLTKTFPSEELYALSSQMKRASVSIPSNIAEGYGRNSTQSYIHFLKIARGSLYELETQLILADKLHFIRQPTDLESTLALLTEESKMLNSFIRKLEDKIIK
jgi:four helix bundle protein